MPKSLRVACNRAFSYNTGKEKERIMAKFTREQLQNFDPEQVIDMCMMFQDQLEQVNTNMEVLIEQLRLANQKKYGRKTEKMDQIPGQLSIFDTFNEAEASADLSVSEPEPEEVLVTVRRKKKKGQREADYRDLPHEVHRHELTDEQLDAFYGKGCWKRWNPDRYLRLRIQPAVYTVEEHIVDAAVGTDGDHQDEYLRGDRPVDLIENSVLTHSLMAAILHSKYTNALPFYRMEQQFASDGIAISRQTMSNWTITVTRKYLDVMWERLRQELLKQPVTQADETHVQVIHDNNPDDPSDNKRGAGHKNWMWVHRSGQFYKEHQVVLFEYQRGRDHRFPKEFYKGYKGVLETDGLQQYHMLERMLPEYTNASCWVHARRFFADAIKAADKPEGFDAKKTVAGQALMRIGVMYEIENSLANLSAEERLEQRQKRIGPLVDEFFEWAEKTLAESILPAKMKVSQGLSYCVNQKKYLKVFLTNGDVPMDNSASERAIRPFTVGRKNWMFQNTVNGAKASAVVYSLVETAKANGLNVYQYLDYLLEEMPRIKHDAGKLTPDMLDPLLPWADELPERCRSKKKR